MSINVKKKRNSVSIHVDGFMTIRNASVIREKFKSHVSGPYQCEVNLSGVTEIDTTGIQLLIQAKREAGRNNIPLKMVAHSKAVYEAIETYNLAAYFGDPLWISGRQVK